MWMKLEMIALSEGSHRGNKRSVISLIRGIETNELMYEVATDSQRAREQTCGQEGGSGGETLHSEWRQIKGGDLTVAITTLPYYLPQPGVTNAPGHPRGRGQDGEFTRPSRVACRPGAHIKA